MTQYARGRPNAMAVGFALATLIGYYATNPGGHDPSWRLGVAALLAVVASTTVTALSRLDS